jgi:hypothetical protein
MFQLRNALNTMSRKEREREFTICSSALDNAKTTLEKQRTQGNLYQNRERSGI